MCTMNWYSWSVTNKWIVWIWVAFCPFSAHWQWNFVYTPTIYHHITAQIIYKCIKYHLQKLKWTKISQKRIFTLCHSFHLENHCFFFLLQPKISTFMETKDLFVHFQHHFDDANAKVGGTFTCTPHKKTATYVRSLKYINFFLCLCPVIVGSLAENDGNFWIFFKLVWWKSFSTASFVCVCVWICKRKAHPMTMQMPWVHSTAKPNEMRHWKWHHWAKRQRREKK